MKSEAIKFYPFNNSRHQLRINLLYTSNWLRNEVKCFLEPHGITHQQLNILRILKKEYPKVVGVQLIREKMVDRMSDISRLVDRLHRKNLVKKIPSPADKRLVEISISEKGLDLLEKIEKDVYRLDNIFLGLTDGEISILNTLLDKARKKPPVRFH